jgi:hypothetical protein
MIPTFDTSNSSFGQINLISVQSLLVIPEVAEPQSERQAALSFILFSLQVHRRLHPRSHNIFPSTVDQEMI